MSDQHQMLLYVDSVSDESPVGLGCRRWVRGQQPLKRLYLPKSPAGGVGAGKLMLPIRCKTVGLVRGILPLLRRGH